MIWVSHGLVICTCLVGVVVIGTDVLPNESLEMRARQVLELCWEKKEETVYDQASPALRKKRLSDFRRYLGARLPLLGGYRGIQGTPRIRSRATASGPEREVVLNVLCERGMALAHVHFARHDGEWKFRLLDLDFPFKREVETILAHYNAQRFDLIYSALDAESFDTRSSVEYTAALAGVFARLGTLEEEVGNRVAPYTSRRVPEADAVAYMQRHFTVAQGEVTTQCIYAWKNGWRLLSFSLYRKRS